MPNYRRNCIPAGTYFFTAVIQSRSQGLLVDNINAFKAAVAATRRQRPFFIDAWVVLPDHTHAIWTLPPGDADYAGRWRSIKTRFSKILNRRQGTVWQRGYWEHTVRTQVEFAAYFDYIHINPLKHGLVGRVIDWPHSTFHYYVKAGTYAPDWAGGVEDGTQHELGEPRHF